MPMETTNIVRIIISSEHFGIVSVDFKDPKRPRMLKKSASWWQNVIAARKIDRSC